MELASLKEVSRLMTPTDGERGAHKGVVEPPAHTDEITEHEEKRGGRGGGGGGGGVDSAACGSIG